MPIQPDEKDTKYILSILGPLTEYPEAISVTRLLDERGVFMVISLHPDDMGRVIGRNGDTSRAVRHLVRQFGMRFKTRISIKILEPTNVSVVGKTLIS